MRVARGKLIMTLSNNSWPRNFFRWWDTKKYGKSGGNLASDDINHWKIPLLICSTNFRVVLNNRKSSAQKWNSTDAHLLQIIYVTMQVTCVKVWLMKPLFLLFFLQCISLSSHDCSIFHDSGADLMLHNPAIWPLPNPYHRWPSIPHTNKVKMY